jgi:hypothetical protein
MPTRQKNGRLVVHSPPVTKAHGRDLPSAAAVHARVEPGDPAHRYIVAMVERQVARILKERTKYRNAKRRAERARAELLQQPGGHELVHGIALALTADGGDAIRSACKAHVDVRPYAIKSAINLVHIVREHHLTSTAALVHATEWAMWSAVARVLLDRALERGIDVLSIGKTTHKGSETYSTTGGAFGDLVKLAGLASDKAAKALGWADVVEKQARDAQKQKRPDLSALLAPQDSETAPRRGHGGLGTPASSATVSNGVGRSSETDDEDDEDDEAEDGDGEGMVRGENPRQPVAETPSAHETARVSSSAPPRPGNGPPSVHPDAHGSEAHPANGRVLEAPTSSNTGNRFPVATHHGRNGSP